MAKRTDVLYSGGHQSADDKMCLMEAVAYMAGEPHSASPQCACPVLAAFGRRLNDRLNDADRQQLLPYVERLLSTKSTREIEIKRGRALAWAAVTNFAPFILEQKGFVKEAQTMRETPNQDFKEGRVRARAAYSAAAAYAAAYAAADAAAADATKPNLNLAAILAVFDQAIAIKE